MSLRTSTDAPTRARAARLASRSSSTGRSALGQTGRDVGHRADPGRPRTPGPPVPPARRAPRPRPPRAGGSAAAGRGQHLAGAADHGHVGLAVARVDGEHGRGQAHARCSRLCATRRSVRVSAYAYWPISGWASRARKTRSRPPRRGRLQGQLLVRRHVRDQAREERVQAGDRQRDGARRADRRLHLDHRLVRQERQRALVQRVHHLVRAASAAQQGRRQVHGRLRVVGAAALGEQGRLLGQLRVAVHRQQLPFHGGHFRRPGGLGAQLAHHLVVGVVVAQVVGGDDAEAVQQGAGQAHVVGDGVAVPGQQLGEDVRALGAAEADPRLPGEVVQAHVVQVDVLGVGAEQRRELALEADRHVAQAHRPVAGLEQGAGDDADGVGEVDDPRARIGAADPFGDVQDHRDRAQGLRQAARAGGLLADAAALQRPGLVLLAGRLAADAGAGAARRRRRRLPASRSEVVTIRPGWACLAKIRRARPPTGSRRSAAGSTSTSSSTGRVSLRRAKPSTSSGV